MGSGLFLQAEEQPWIIWSWLFTHVQLFVDAIEQHLLLTVIAVGVGLAISLPLAVLAHRWRRLRNPVLTVFGIFYTIPSLALFSVLVPYTGLSVLTAEIGLVGYTVLILARNILVGLEAVPADVIDAADGMGYRRTARLLRVELPLALPAIFAGVRIATGSDFGGGSVRPGHLAWEVEMLVRAGLEAHEALASATWIGGELLGLPDAGMIETGGPADVVLVHGDPLSDPAALWRVWRVYHRGERVS